jgi:hypothetical protein
MEAGFRTPLLDFFRRGDVARDIRLLAAQGALAPRAYEQLGLLMLLVNDPDREIAAAAESTLSAIPPGSLAAFLARADVSAEMRSFFADRGLTPAAAASDSDVPLLDTAPEPERIVDADDDGSKQESAFNRIMGMNMAQKLALAMKGSREERAILIRDPNKIVGAAVLSSPRLTESEVESIAKMTTISDELLRMIANTRAWTKNYAVVLALTRNPKTPLAISMNMLPRLNDRDLRQLSNDRNIPDVLRVTARKKVVFQK